jgi:hypothetical protein
MLRNNYYMARGGLEPGLSKNPVNLAKTWEFFCEILKD